MFRRATNGFLHRSKGPLATLEMDRSHATPIAIGSPKSGRGDAYASTRIRHAARRFGGSAVGWPLAARAQQPKMPVIGYLSTQSAEDDHNNFIVPFLQGLKITGHVEGQNVAAPMESMA
jgi:hypothetical protein